MKPEIKKALRVVLDYVEDWNKMDEDEEVARAMYDLETWLAASMLGSITSKKKSDTARANGKLGGRPRSRSSGEDNK